MKSQSSLPIGYEEFYSVDLQNDKKMAFLINFFVVVIALIFGIPAHFAVPISTLFSMDDGISNYFIRFLALAVLSVAYIILHELVHGLAMKLCGTKKIKFGFTGMYAFAGSDDYYYKKPYIFIALAPVVLWGIVLAVVNIFVPTSWFWVVYFIQLFNLSGAAGDLFVTFRFLRFPKDILIKDYGVKMIVYSPK